jgi:hypothetical protein
LSSRNSFTIRSSDANYAHAHDINQLTNNNRREERRLTLSMIESC